MKPNFEQLKQALKQRKIHLSIHRLKVLAYLSKVVGHPTVDEIYSALLKELPSLSKTTVYNTLRLLKDAGLVRVVNIDENEARYDLVTSVHGHFMCVHCQLIEDFPLPIGILDFHLSSDHLVTEKKVYFKGICKSCQASMNNTNKEDIE